MTPIVTFIIPCYKLAHLLSECVNSILQQSYQDFEVLILDDCSPDDTSRVAQSFEDPRIRYIRNETNLGHLPNYNKGIELACGKYIWLISADDRLRQIDVLERYVRVLDAHPNVGYVFCPAMGLENSKESGRLEWTVNGERDEVWDGKRFLQKLLSRNSVAAPSALVRSVCYQQISMFPLDLPYAGDWYLWCIFALHYDVAYFSEPMVNYRLHPLSMTNRLTQQHRVSDNLAVQWRMKTLAERAEEWALVRACLESIARHYAYCLACERFQTHGYSLTIERFEQSVRENAASQSEQRRLRARSYARFGDACYGKGDSEEALRLYLIALKLNYRMPIFWLKAASLRMGAIGRLLRQGLTKAREGLTLNKLTWM